MRAGARDMKMAHHTWIFLSPLRWRARPHVFTQRHGTPVNKELGKKEKKKESVTVRDITSPDNRNINNSDKPTAPFFVVIWIFFTMRANKIVNCRWLYGGLLAKRIQFGSFITTRGDVHNYLRASIYLKYNCIPPIFQRITIRCHSLPFAVIIHFLMELLLLLLLLCAALWVFHFSRQWPLRKKRKTAVKSFTSLRLPNEFLGEPLYRHHYW